MLAVQYLEPGPDTASIEIEAARTRLRAAFEHLPIDGVILGWGLPEALKQACVEETGRADARLFHWHPLLTGHSGLEPRLDWQTVGLSGERVPGFQGLAEFTFLCPNRPAVAEAVRERLRREIAHGPYQGVCLDRIRYPSPAANPGRWLACFCPDCRRAAIAEGLDLVAAQRSIQALPNTPERRRWFVRVLLDSRADISSDADLALLQRFIEFRTHSITRLVQAAAGVVRDEGLQVGLDCFSPVLTSLVGQGLAALDTHCDWIKIMTYGHTWAPAGMPYELGALARWLTGRGSPGEAEALNELAQAAHLPLPTSLDALRAQGLSPQALAAEVRCAQSAGVRTVLTGIELVDLDGVVRLDSAQIAADLRALRAANVDGLVLSWDLWRMPLERLQLVHSIWNAD